MNGFLCVLKPPGMTSSDVVVRVRRKLGRGAKVGHAGTLDPEASGVLPLMIGRAARLFDYLVEKEKTYVAQLKPGYATDTQDAHGAIVSGGGARATRAQLEAVLPRFIGDIAQIPPMYSAIKIGGKKLYELARKGQEVERKPRNITIFELAVEDGSGSDWDLRVRCSKGTYVRTLCHDIGQSLGCGGCMSSLRRTRAGRFTLEQAVTMEQILAFAQEHDPAELLMPVDALFAQHPALIVTLGQTEKLKHGASIRDWHFADGTYRVYSETGEFLLLGTVKRQVLTTVKSFFEV